MWVQVVISIFLLLWPIGAFAQTEKRIALLIGNRDYKAGVGSLTNPLNDIRIVGDALKSVGFEVLKPTQNATRVAMLRAIHEFAGKLKSAGPDAVGFLYYSGHGIASAGENYLMPVDVEEPSTLELSMQGVKQSEVLAILRGEAPNAAHYLVLDACRNTLQGARGGKGFVPVGQQSGVLVAFATEPGKTATDLGQGSGPYAAALAAELVQPGQSDLIMFHNVRVAVMDKTNGDQVPWTEDGIQRRQRVLFGGEIVAPVPPTAPAANPMQAAGAADVVRVCREVEAMTSLSMLAVLERQHAGTPAADCISARIGELKESPDDPAKVAALPKIGVGRFDGHWKIDVKSETCSVKKAQFSIVIENGVIGGRVKAGSVSGTLSASGVARWRQPGLNDSRTVVHSGRFTGNTGSGTFTHPACGGGTFTATRQ